MAKAQDQLRKIFHTEKAVNAPVFKDLTEGTYDQLSRGGIYNIYGRRMNITPRIYDENGMWTGEYKDWSHLQEITVTQGHFEYLNADWLFMDQRPDKNFRHFNKEAYIFDKKCLVIQDVGHEFVTAKILTGDEELKLYIEDILEFKPRRVIPKREIREINQLEYQGLKFGSNQIDINVNRADDQFDKNDMLITNIDHYDNYIYEVYDTLRNIFTHINNRQAQKLAEEQIIWLEEWIDRPLTNDIQTIMTYMDDKVVQRLRKYTYRNRNFWDRQACGSLLFKDAEIKKFDIDEMDYVIVNGKKMDQICQELDIPISIGWDIWKLLNKSIMSEIVEGLSAEYFSD